MLLLLLLGVEVVVAVLESVLAHLFSSSASFFSDRHGVTESGVQSLNVRSCTLGWRSTFLPSSAGAVHAPRIAGEAASPSWPVSGARKSQLFMAEEATSTRPNGDCSSLFGPPSTILVDTPAAASVLTWRGAFTLLGATTIGATSAP